MFSWLFIISMDKVMEKKGILSRLKQLMNQISSDFKQKDRTTRINELTSHSLREANRMVVSVPQTTGSDSVGDILNDWNESSFEQNESDTSKNQDGSFEKYVVKSNGSDNEKGNVSDDEGFSGSNAAEGFNSSRNQDSKKRRKGNKQIFFIIIMSAVICKACNDILLLFFNSC